MPQEPLASAYPPQHSAAQPHRLSPTGTQRPQAETERRSPEGRSTPERLEGGEGAPAVGGWKRLGPPISTAITARRRFRYFGVIFVILLPWMPRPAISPFCPKTNA